MRKLIRPQEPTVLKKLTKRGTNWKDVTPAERKQIRASLDEMSTRGTNTFCNYCEKSIGESNRGHIEHLVPRKSQPNLRFEWANLFLSCNSADHCGEFKDSPRSTAYEPDTLIRPDQEDPETLLQFFSTGKVEPRPGLDPTSQQRAQKTIEVLNLNDQKLITARSAIAKQAETLLFDFIDDLEALSAEERTVLFQDEINAFADSPFLTTVRQLFLEW